tara:strand:+ start:17724 stop:17963 length:240 start_codon:yes stop_codon:yes gene_type:complete
MAFGILLMRRQYSITPSPKNLNLLFAMKSSASCEIYPKSIRIGCFGWVKTSQWEKEDIPSISLTTLNLIEIRLLNPDEI